MLNYNDLKLDTVFILDSQPYQVLESNFLRMQQRKPVVQAKIKNLMTGKIIDRTFHQNENFEEAEIEKQKVRYLYSHRNLFFFCYENDPAKRFELSQNQIGNASKYLKPNLLIETIIFNEKIINISLPIKMDFKVIEAPPDIKGNTAQGGTKIVTLETGVKINAPLFIKQGNIIKINTQTGQYVERVKI